MRCRRPLSRRLPVLAALVALVLASAPAPGQSPPSDPGLDEVEAMLERGDAEGARERLDRALARDPGNARARLLRSTALFVLGEVAAGRTDLERALELDPGLRQAWLNLAGLEIAEERYDRAAAALLEARDLDPAAADNEPNLGAVRLLQGRAEEAAAHFQAYLDANPGSAEAIYLVASNYAMSGRSDTAVALLTRAIELDERTRLRARTDPNFSDLELDPRFRRLLATDAYRPPAGAHHATQRFDTPYLASQGRLLPAVLDALQASGRPFDPRIEVTPDWALVWSDVRIRVTPVDDGHGEVSLSAPPESFTETEWRERSAELFRQITIQLIQRRGPAVPPRPGG